MIYLRKHIEQYNGAARQTLVTEKGVKPNEAPSKAIKYPGYLIRFTVGGYVITFHLFLCIAFIPRLIVRHRSAFKYVPEVLLSLLILYMLQLLIARILGYWMGTPSEAQQHVAGNAHNQGTSAVRRATTGNASNQGTNTVQASTDRDTSTGCCRWYSRFRDTLNNVLQYFILVASKISPFCK